MAGGADRGEGSLGRKPGARCDVEDLHTRRYVRGTQQEGHEVRGDVRERTVILCRRRVLEG